MSVDKSQRVVRVEIPIESDEELAALKGALLAARATEPSQIRRRAGRLSYGHGTDSARETIRAEVDHAQRRWSMLDRTLTALETARTDEHG